MAKKANSAFDGNLIQIKRTALDPDNSSVEADGNLKYGEPLYFDTEEYLVVGNSQETKTKSLKVFKAVPRNLAEGTLFYNQSTKGSDSNRVDLIDENENKIFPKLKQFTTRNDAGIPKDSAGNTILVKKFDEASLTNWYKVDTQTGLITEDTAGKDDFPKAQIINISGMTEDTIPFISLALSNLELGNKEDTKSAKKTFGNLTHVKSMDSKIILYCSYKNLNQDCYLDVFGG